MANNTGNPIGSTAAKDLSDNAESLDKLLNGEAYEYTDRLGRERKSLQWMEDAALAIPAIDAALRSEQQAERSEQQAGQSKVEAERSNAARREAEAARDTFNLNVGRKADIAEGLRDTVSGQSFTVLAPDAEDFIIEYKNNSGVALEMKRYPSMLAVTAAMDVLATTHVTGISGTPITGAYYSPNTRVFAEPVAETGTIRKIRLFSGGDAHTIKVRRFSSSGSGPLRAGDVLTQVGDESSFTYYGQGVHELVANIPVKKGEYIGVYDSELSYSYAAAFPIAAFAIAAARGDYAALTVSALPAGYALQIGFDVVSDYVNTQRVKSIETDVSQLKTVSDAVEGIPERLSAANKIGLSGLPIAGAYYSPNTRVFVDPVVETGAIRKVRLFSGEGAHTLKVRRFASNGTGPLTVGSVLAQVGTDQVIKYTGAGAQELVVDIPVNKGEFIGFYDSALSYTYAAAPSIAAFAVAAAQGDYSALTVSALPAGYALQIGFDVVYDYVNTPRVQALESGLLQLQTAANVVVEDIALLPKTVAGVQGVVTGEPMGPVWYDGFVWHWTKDNSIVPNPGMRLLDLARRDGWLSLYDVSNKAALTTLTSGGVQYISGIKDGLNGSPDALQTVAGKYPELSPAGLGGKASAKFSGVEHLHIAGMRKLSQPYFLLSVANFTGPTDVVGSSGKFLFDGLAPDRAAIIGDDMPGGNIRGWATSSVEGSLLSSAPVVFGMQFNGEHSESWVNGWSYSIATTPMTNGLTLGKVGADWQGGRNWIGNLAALLVYEGAPSRAKLERMQALLFDLYGITKPPLSLTAQGASLVRLSDMQVMYEKNPSTIIHVASVTKAMTALVLDRWVSDLSQTITVDASDIIFESQTSFVKAGDVISYVDLMRSALMPSDNNAATAISRCVGQLINPAAATPALAKSAFVAEMNAVAALLGMTSTTYNNAYEGCLTTATDLPKLLAHINTNAPRVMAAGGLMHHSVQVTGTNPRTLSFDHTINANAVPGFLFGKTGSGLGFGSVITICEREGTKYAVSILRADERSRLREVRWLMDEATGALP